MTKIIFYILIFLSILDAILINTVIDPFLIHKESLVHLHKYFGFYQRPPSFGGSASVTSVCLIVFAAILDINGKKLKLYDLAILLITILLLINTTGLIIFILYLILRNYFLKILFFNSSYRAIINFPFLMFYFSM